MIIKTPSPTRTYVAVCNSGDFTSRYFRKFTLPEKTENTINFAAWYFLNRVNLTACIDFVMPYEDYLDITDEKVRSEAYAHDIL